MRIRIVDNWQRDRVDVFVFTRASTGDESMPSTIERHVEGDVWRTEEVGDVEPFTQLPKPSLSLPRPVLESIIEQYQRESSSDRDAVNDARGTRDRLLALVETIADRQADSPVSIISETRGRAQP